MPPSPGSNAYVYETIYNFSNHWICNVLLSFIRALSAAILYLFPDALFWMLFVLGPVENFMEPLIELHSTYKTIQSQYSILSHFIKVCFRYSKSVQTIHELWPPPLKPCILPFIASLFDVPIGSGSKRRQSTLQLVRSVPSRVGGSRFIDFSIETYSFRIWF